VDTRRLDRDHVHPVSSSHVGDPSHASCPDGADATPGTPRQRRHHGVTAGSTKNNSATTMIVPEIGRRKKIVSDPWDMMRLWRRAFSARSPSTRASTSGARG